ncbi:MAG TPA: MerR family transcriptional regulator [Polyangiaceae bacterium]
MVEPRYRIGTAARLSGVSTHLIRVWERRYEALEPDRTGGGARLYSPADLERLRLLKRAVGRGHSIGQIARLDRADLERLGGRSHEPVVDEQIEAFIQDFLRAVERFDGERAEELLVRASVEYSARSMVSGVLGPLLERVGDEWASGKLCVASEHLASALVRNAVGELLRRLPKRRGAALVVVTTPEGELHELGALLCAATVALEGYRVLYLGASSPAAEIARVVQVASASIVALSVVSLEPELAVQAIRALLAELPEHVELVLGGTMAERIRGAVGPRALVPEGLAGLEQWLEARHEA